MNEVFEFSNRKKQQRQQQQQQQRNMHSESLFW